MDNSEKFLTIENVSVSLSGNEIVKNVSFELDKGEIGCLLGCSGSGKTTMLRAISGFERISHGSISLNGKKLTTAKKIISPENRNIGIVLQDLALFPHLTLRQNISFGLRSMTKAEICIRVDELLKIVGLTQKANSYPHEISGGQQQRIALLRAIAPKPDLVLLDEVFSSLDYELRRSLAKDIRDLLKSENITAILVTHDHEEAFNFAEKAGILNSGVLEQFCLCKDLYHRPLTGYVGTFVGEGILIDAQLQTDGRVSTEFGEFESKKGTLSHDVSLRKRSLIVRPEDLEIAKASDAKSLEYEVLDSFFRNGKDYYRVRFENLGIMSLNSELVEGNETRRLSIAEKPYHIF